MDDYKLIMDTFIGKKKYKKNDLAAVAIKANLKWNIRENVPDMTLTLSKQLVSNGIVTLGNERPLARENITIVKPLEPFTVRK